MHIRDKCHFIFILGTLLQIIYISILIKTLRSAQNRFLGIVNIHWQSPLCLNLLLSHQSICEVYFTVLKQSKLFSSSFIEINWHIALCKFKVYSIMVWLTSWNNDCKKFSEHPSSCKDIKLKKQKKVFFPCDENSSDLL